MSGTLHPVVFFLALGGAAVALGVHAWLALAATSAQVVGLALLAVGLTVGLVGAMMGRMRVAGVGAIVAALSLLASARASGELVGSGDVAIVVGLLVALEAGYAVARSRSPDARATPEAIRSGARALTVRLVALVAIVAALALTPRIVVGVLPPLVSRSIEITSPLALAIAGWTLILLLVTAGAARRIRERPTRE